MLRRNKIYAVLTLSTFLFSAGGCAYGPPRDRSKFVTARVDPNRKMGVFSYKKLIDRPATGINAFPDGGIPKYVVDRDYIAMYDFKTKKVKIIYQSDNLRGKWAHGQGKWNVSSVFGKTAVVLQNGQRRSDLRMEGHDYFLDLDSGKLTLFPLDKELAQLKVGRGYFYLIDEAGTLILVCRPLKDDPTIKPGAGKVSYLVIRYPDGKCEKIAKIMYYYGMKGDEVFYWSSDNKYQAYNIKTRRYRLADRKEYGGQTNELDIDLRIVYDRGFKLKACEKRNQEWVCKNVNFRP